MRFAKCLLTAAVTARVYSIALNRVNLRLPTFEGKVVSVKLVLVAACALIDADGRVLIAQRPAGKPMAGLWEFPGGKVEAGERPEDTLIRELKEELGIVVREACLAPLTFASHAYPDFHLLMPLYVCRRWEGTVTAKEAQRSPGCGRTGCGTIRCRRRTSRWSRI